MPSITIPVAYTSQFASPNLTADFVNGIRPLESDPNWQQYGTETVDQYAHWARRACGVVCVKMAVDALTDLPPRPIMDWINDGLTLDGYITRVRPDRPDEVVEYGWKHDSLVELTHNQGLWAERFEGLTPADLVAHLRQGRLTIASVTSQLGEAHTPLTRNSGHLVLVHGAHFADNGPLAHLTLHNPSGRTDALRASARIPLPRFDAGFSGRAIVIGKYK